MVTFYVFYLTDLHFCAKILTISPVIRFKEATCKI